MPKARATPPVRYVAGRSVMTGQDWRSQDSVDTVFPGFVSGFELLRADATEMAVPA